MMMDQALKLNQIKIKFNFGGRKITSRHHLYTGFFAFPAYANLHDDDMTSMMNFFSTTNDYD